MTTLTKPRAILFDWDNTLVNTWPLIHTALNMTLRHMEHPEWTYERVVRDVKKSMRDSFPEMFGDKWQDAAKHYQQSYRSIHLDQLVPLPGAKEMLDAIPDTVFTAIVSNKQGNTLRLELERLGWRDYFDAAVGASDAARDKPHADPVHHALRDCHITPAADVWFIGDTGVDLEVAKVTGCTAILFGDHDLAASPAGHHDGHPYHAHMRDHAALRKLIQETFSS